MGFSEARYLACIGFGAASLGDAIRLLPAADGLLSALPGRDRIELAKKGLCYDAQRSVDSIRQVPYREGAGLETWLSRVEKAEEVGLYVFDKGSDERTPPLLSFNLHLSSTGRLARNRVVDSRSDTPAGSFLAVGLNREISEDFTGFQEAITAFFSDMGGLRGALWREAPHLIDGKASLEWAYRNVSAAIPSGDLARWEPGSDVML